MRVPNGGGSVGLDRQCVTDSRTYFADAMASIANYLKASGWQNSNAARKKKAVYAYNHCDNYVKAVLAYSKASKGKS
jgi:membrane-bound lytic murein transglycosylase B